MKKRTVFIICLLGLLALGGIVVHVIYSLATDGYAYYGGWEETPEEALAYRKGVGMPSESDILTVSTHLDTIYFEDNAEIIYISKAETLVKVVCVRNSEGKWNFYGYSEEQNLENPDSFLLNGDPEQFITNPYSVDEKAKMVYGWKYSNAPDIEVKGHVTDTKSYVFAIGDKEWRIDYWWCEVEDSNYDEIVVDYCDVK